MDKPEISILMANYNKGEYIGQAIESVINQTFSDWELIIIDDNSSDNSVEIIEKYLKDLRIKLYRHEKNVGTTLTQVELIKNVGSDIVGILDSDDALMNNAIQEVLNVCRHKPAFNFIYTQNYFCDEEFSIVGLGLSGKIPEGKSNLHVNRINHFKVFKKGLYLKTVGYDNKMRMAEDIDIILKLEEVSKVYFLDKPLYYYRILKKSNTHSFKNEMINRSSTALAKLNAYKRRLNTDIPNLDKTEMAEVLFFGVFTAILARRFKLMLKLKLALWRINPLFLFQLKFYRLLIKKIIKIKKIKF